MNAADLDALAGRDPVLAGLIERHGPARVGRRVKVATRFGVLVRAIVYQQLAGNAARAIHGRVLALFDGEVTPARLLDTPAEELAACGLSGSKRAALTDLAAKVDGGLVPLADLGRMPDDRVVDVLVQVRGIGVWTAEMFLITALARPDVWPVGDYGVRVGYAAAWGLDELPTPKVLSEMGEPYRPHRSAVAWYCWRVADERKATRSPTVAP